MQPIEQESFLFNLEEKKFQWTRYNYIPGLIKIINEIIDNSIDVAIKSNFKYANEISIDISDTRVQVKDNGYGIPVKENEQGVLLPVIAWGRARAGSNFEDDESRVSAGMNGVGSFSSNVFSKKFTGITDDGTNRVKVIFKNNAESHTVTRLPSTEQGTEVIFFPDLKKFNITEIDKLHQSLIFQRILNLSMMYPEIRFKFNRRVVKLDAKRFLGLFNDDYEFIEEDDYIIAVLPNSAADFNYHTYVNSLWLERGGSHIHFLAGKITANLRERLVRRYKSIKPGDIKNKLTLIAFFRKFPNTKFDSQTKEFLTNTQSEITAFLDFNDPQKKKDWDRFYNKIYKNKAIMDPVTDLYNAKMLIEEKKKLKAATKKQDLPEKYWPATKENKYLFLAEGDSAIGAIIAELGRDDKGFMPLKGKPLNPVKNRSKLASNAELKQIATILGMDLTKQENVLNYENIILAVDRDVDGSAIAGLLTGFFSLFARNYLDEGRVFLFVTPLLSAVDKRDRMHFMFTMDEYNEFREKNDPKGTKFIYDYKKGLGTLDEKEWSELFKQYKLEDLLQPLHLLDSDNPDLEIELLHNWLSDDSEFRKDKVVAKIATFDVNKV
jgi:DNA gyrase/topoisomerase IV subunit B